MSTISPADWQGAFVEKYLRDLPGTAFLTAQPGEGKATAALQVWERLWQDYAFKNLIVITPSVALKEQWRYRALQTTPNHIPAENLQVHNIHRLRGDLPDELGAIYGSGHTLVVLDEIHRLANWENMKELFVPSPIQHPAASRTIYLTIPAVLEQSTLLGHLLSGTEYIYDPAVLRDEIQRKQLAWLSPSQATLQRFWNHGLTLDNITWREFEKLVAELLETDGYTIQLMNGTKDGGVDVVAEKKDGISGYFKTVWQAKRYIKDKVGLSIIRELADSVRELDASKGILVTTSFLTRDALARVQRDKYTLGKVDRNDLQGWIERILYKK